MTYPTRTEPPGNHPRPTAENRHDGEHLDHDPARANPDDHRHLDHDPAAGTRHDGEHLDHAHPTADPRPTAAHTHDRTRPAAQPAATAPPRTTRTTDPPVRVWSRNGRCAVSTWHLLPALDDDDTDPDAPRVYERTDLPRGTIHDVTARLHTTDPDTARTLAGRGAWEITDHDGYDVTDDGPIIGAYRDAERVLIDATATLDHPWWT